MAGSTTLRGTVTRNRYQSRRIMNGVGEEHKIKTVENSTDRGTGSVVV